jgi:hypothetical protein
MLEYHARVLPCMHGAVTGRGHSGGLSSKESAGRTATASTWGHWLMATSLEHACGDGRWWHHSGSVAGSTLQWKQAAVAHAPEDSKRWEDLWTLRLFKFKPKSNLHWS